MCINHVAYLMQCLFTFSVLLPVLFVPIITIFYTRFVIIIIIQEPYFTLTAQEKKKKTQNIRMCHPWSSLTNGNLYDDDIIIIMYYFRL